jgi:predicted membrane protein
MIPFWYSSAMEYDEKWQRQQERMARFQERLARKQERWARRQERLARRRQRHISRSPAHGIVVSLVVIALGVLFLLDNMGILSFHDVARYWPVILIALGVVRLVDSHGTASVVFGALLAGAGSLLLLDNLGIFYFDWRLFWPVVLIGVGVLMLLRTHHRQQEWHEWQQHPDTSGAPPAPGTINLWAMFSGGERRIDAKDFRGGSIGAMFGGFEVDLRGATMAEAQATIDISAMFGGVEIQIPETWVAEVKGSALFGGFVDETVPPPAGQPAPRLIVTGYAMFGGITVSN